MSQAEVVLWGTSVGYVSMEPGEVHARFEYDPAFVEMGIELSPLHMPAAARKIYQFRELHPRSFHGLPGLLSDSLPDKYGNRLIDVWLARTGRSAEAFNAVDRLCYVGQRAMGALEYVPSVPLDASQDQRLEMRELVELASLAFISKQELNTRLTRTMASDQLLSLVSIGTSAGGARAKAVIAYDPASGEVRSGQTGLLPGFEHWLIKFDGVQNSGDWGVADPAGYGLLEYSYYLTARECGIDMMESRVFAENGRHHFMTRRFDRGPNGEKHFMQTYAALAHADYYESGAYSYEQVILAMRQLQMSQTDIEEMVRRIVFNLVGCNQDDHVKNISFMMNRRGEWRLSPAYDLCHSEGSAFTARHQLSLNGKTTDFTLADLKHLASYADLPRGREKQILEQTIESFSHWQQKACELDIPQPLQNHVNQTLRLEW